MFKKVKNMKKGQSAMEFVILFSFMLLIFSGFFVAIQEKILDVSEQKDMLYLEEINNIIVTEVNLATRTKTDYHRSFEIPRHIKGNIFEIELIDNFDVLIRYKDKEYINFLNEKVSGPLYLGENEIHHLDGIMKLGNETHNNSYYKGIFLNTNPELCYFYENTDIDGQTLCEIYRYIYPTRIELCAYYFNLCYDEDEYDFIPISPST